jgi:hypothetical protein
MPGWTGCRIGRFGMPQVSCVVTSSTVSFSFSTRYRYAQASAESEADPKSRVGNCAQLDT